MWQLIRPRLEEVAKPVKEARLRRKYEQLKVDRRNVVHQLYNEYKAALLPSQWKYLPRTIDICRFDCFDALIRADANVAPIPEVFAECIDRLPELLSARQEAIKVAVSGKMLSGISASTEIAGQAGTMETLLCSVAAAFECRAWCGTNVDNRKPRIIFGIDEIASHYCGYELEGLRLISSSVQSAKRRANFEFDTKASFYAKLLAQCAGLGAYVSVARMDAEGLRFMCAQCEEIRFEGNSLYVVGFGWREVVSFSYFNKNQSFTHHSKFTYSRVFIDLPCHDHA